MNPQFKKFTWIEISITALALALFLWWLLPFKIENKELATELPPQAKIFPEISLEAKSAYVLDAKTGETLYEKEPELQWPLASLTKLMVVLTASESIPDYMLVRITADDVREEGDTGLLVGEEWNLKKLIDYSLVVSSNDGIKAIASVAGSEIARATTTDSSPENLFMERMNELAKEIGLAETYFLNNSGLDLSSNLSGGYGSAKDIALLVDYILKTNPRILEATTFSEIVIESKTKNHNATNTNKSVEKIPNVLASKTGYTLLSGGNVVLAFNAGLDRPVIISVLGSSYDGRFEDLNKLVNATLEYLAP